MKRFALTILAALIAAATTAHAGWWKTYGGEDWDEACCIQITSDGNYIISGAKNDSLWLIKTDTSGEVIWERTYGESDGTRSRWLEETSDGGYIIAPRTPSLLKVNAQGDTVWSGDYGMYSYCAQETRDGGYVVVGGDFGYPSNNYLILVKTDSNGDTLWTKTYGDGVPSRYTGFFIQETSDSGFIITGRKGIASEEYSSEVLWLVKTDSSGDTIWTKEYGEWNDGETDGGFCVRQTKDGGYIIVGHKNFPPRGLWLLKTDFLGDTIWTRTYAAPSSGEGYCVQEIDGGYIISGVTGNWFTASFSTDGTDLWLLKTDMNGDTLWTRFYGGEDSDMGFCVQQTADSGFVVVGYTESFGAGRADIFLLKTDSLGLLCVLEEPSLRLENNWKVVTPVARQITLRYSNCPDGLSVSIYDACGRNVDVVYSPGPEGSLTWGDGYPAGVYFFCVKSDNTYRTERAVLIH